MEEERGGGEEDIGGSGCQTATLNPPLPIDIAAVESGSRAARKRRIFSGPDLARNRPDTLSRPQIYGPAVR